INDIKTKRYTRTRLNRLMISILLNITKDRMEDYVLPDAVRVLAMNRTGQQYLRQLPEGLEIITNVNNKNRNSIIPEMTTTDNQNVFSDSDKHNINTPVIVAGRTSPRAPLLQVAVRQPLSCRRILPLLYQFMKI